MRMVMMKQLRRLHSILGSGMQIIVSCCFVLLIACGLILSRTHGMSSNQPFKQWAPTEAIWDTAQSEVEVVSNQLRFEPEWVDRLLSFLISFDAVAPRVIGWSPEADLPSCSPVERYGRLFSLPPPV